MRGQVTDLEKDQARIRVREQVTIIETIILNLKINNFML